VPESDDYKAAQVRNCCGLDKCGGNEDGREMGTFRAYSAS